jgi:chemotaxis-related protein WspB
MLMLLFQLGDSRYAIPARDVVEVTPRVRLEPLASTPVYVAGLLNYRSEHVPVIDLCQLINSRACRNSLTTRIILVQVRAGDNSTGTLGLLAEAVTETVRIEQDAFADTGVTVDDAPFLGQAAHSSRGLVRKITVAELLPHHVRSQLFASAVQ